MCPQPRRLASRVLLVKMVSSTRKVCGNGVTNKSLKSIVNFNSENGDCTLPNAEPTQAVMLPAVWCVATSACTALQWYGMP